MAEEIVIGVAAEAAKSLISQSWLEIQCVLNYNSNIKKLKETVDDLESKENTIKLRVDEATNNAKDIGPDVLHWLKKVDNIKQEVNKFLEHTRNSQWGCLYCKCPKLHLRYKLSKQALEWTTELIGLLDASKFEIIGYPAQLGKMPFTSPGEFDGFVSRMMKLNDVMEALGDHSIAVTGICGMPGVGKTTLAKEIADKVKAANLFDEVAWATVSNDAVVAKVQDELAESLGMKFEEKTDRGRAERLWTRLMNQDKRVLVILDDLWKKLDLRDIGIPIKGERGGLKVLLTSRYKRVCDSMGAKTFVVDVLSEKESWHLFKEIAEISEEANEIKKMAVEVAKECGGLPLAIVIVGGAMKNKEDYAWRVALEELKAASVSNIPDMEEFVFSRIKLSYTNLEDNSKLLLLLCSLFPEDYDIPLEYLVRYATGLQSSYLFKDVKTISQVRDRVCMITDELKRCYLLLEGNEEKCVKLHDVVRDACLSIASKGEHMHTVKYEKLKEWPQEDSYASSTAISLTFGAINQLFSTMEYPKLELLRMRFENSSLHLCEDIFERMKEVKVLDLLYLNSKLPSSLQSLVNLRTLCLDCCKLYGDLSVIGSQKELEFLSFYDSYLEHFPNNISELSNLKSLDLRFKKGPPLPSGILVRLEKLEELYLDSNFQEWERKGEEAYSVIIAEISSLLKLQTIRFCAYDSRCLEQVLEKLHLRDKLMRFKITLTSLSESAGEYQFGKVMNLKDINDEFLKKNATQCLLQKTEDLTLKEVKGLTNLVSELDGKGFVNLKTLNLEGSCCDLRYVVDATSFHTSGGGAFINLEELSISYAENLEELCHGILPLGSFARLRNLELENLAALRSCGLARSLLQLQWIKIVDCPKLETIVSNKKEGENNHVEFPKLTSLNLRYLDSFRSFVPESSPSGALFEKIFLPNLEDLHIHRINGIRCVVDGQMTFGSLSKLQNIEISGCDSLVHVIASADSVKLLHNLQRLRCIDCKSMEVVFDFKVLIYEELQSLGTPLAWLEELYLQYLPKLKHIFRMLPEEIHAFKNLRSLVVYKCASFKYLLSPSMAKMLAGLESLILHSCAQMKAIIGVDERESTEYIVVKKEGNQNTSKLEFPKLKRIEVVNLPNFRILCSENIELELPWLTELVIEDCPNMTKFCDGRLIATSLNNVDVIFYRYGERNKKEVVLNEFSSWLKDCESRIQCIKCSFYEIESCDHLD